MKPEAQRVAIAEWCGFDTKTYQTGGVRHYRDKNGRMLAALPDYPNDLNVMHEAEAGLLGNQMIRYQSELNNVTTKNPHVACWDFIHATAAQRAEALLRTIGRWDDKEVLK